MQVASARKYERYRANLLNGTLCVDPVDHFRNRSSRSALLASNLLANCWPGSVKLIPEPQSGRFHRPLLKRKEVLSMRSQLIFGALTHVRNRYELCQLASKAARKLHKPTTRLQDTMNDVLIRFRQSDPMGENNAVVEKARTQERRAA
jgi:hypothetical protein